MEVAAGVVALVAVVTFVSALSTRYQVPAPLALTLVGVGGSFVPGVPTVELSPEFVLTGLLPPLLYAAALKTSLIDFRRNARPIALLSVGLIVANTVVVGFIVWWLLPVQPAAAFALGAVVAPPDAVAATAIVRRVGMPRRAVTILQGESLVNDATALVLLRTATAALVSGSVSVVTIGRDFVVVALGGIAVGVVVAFVTGRIRSYIRDETIDTAVSIITPFTAYLIAEEFNVSGVLAVVFTGLILSHKAHLMQAASSRIFERTNWATIEFLLENAVFLLIGLQVRQILTAAGSSDLSSSTIVGACVIVTLTVIVVRPLWIFPATYLPRLIPSIAARDPIPPWTIPAAISWAGMRGVVTLAAAFVLPAATKHRDVLILIALTVVGATLLIQSSTLPWLLRRLRLTGPDPGEDALQAASVQQQATAAGLARLDEIVTDADSDEVVGRVRRRSRERVDAMWERLGGGDETPSAGYARLRIAMIEAERAELIRLRDTGAVADEVMRTVMASIDIEETVLDRAQQQARTDRVDELTPPGEVSACEHMAELPTEHDPRTPDGCEECLELGWRWVHLRMCLTCGHVGCCDSSVGKHATAHFNDVAHPVMRSIEPHEAWRWCFVDNVTG